MKKLNQIAPLSAKRFNFIQFNLKFYFYIFIIKRLIRNHRKMLFNSRIVYCALLLCTNCLQLSSILEQNSDLTKSLSELEKTLNVRNVFVP